MDLGSAYEDWRDKYDAEGSSPAGDFWTHLDATYKELRALRPAVEPTPPSPAEEAERCLGARCGQNDFPEAEDLIDKLLQMIADGELAPVAGERLKEQVS